MASLPRSRASLRHPLWWSALALLVLNDHVLKHAGLLPGWLTGKLSDFAGLVVAPVLFAAVLRARSDLARAAAFAVAVVPFVAINLSPALAALVEHATRSLGIPWRIWTDPPDLVALASLPVAWHLAEGDPAHGRARAVERVAVILGGLACMATSPPPPEPFPGTYSTTTYFSNRTEAPIDLRVQWLDADVDCAAVTADPARALDPDLFDDPITFTLAPGENVPLDHDAAYQAAGTPVSMARTSIGCDAALISTDGVPRSLAMLGGRGARAIPPTGDAETASGQISLVVDGDGVKLDPHDVELVEALERAEPSACFDPSVQTFEASIAGLPSLGSYRLDATEVGADGCIVASLTDDLDETPHTIFLCVPSWAFPFAAGDLLHVETAELAAGALRIRKELPDGTFGTTVELHHVFGSFDTGTLRGTLGSDACGGDRTECGAYVRSAVLEVRTPDGASVTVRPGDAIELGEIGDRNVVAALGRAEEVVVARASCQPHQRQLGSWADLILIYEEVVR